MLMNGAEILAFRQVAPVACRQLYSIGKLMRQIKICRL